MGVKEFLKKKRPLWHRHFVPSLIAGIAVALIALAYKATVSNIILFASVGASAIILTNSESHHLTKLMTVIYAYVTAIILSSLVYFLNIFVSLHIAVNIFLLIFLVGIALFLINSFHPPAITASLSFIVLDRLLGDLLYLFVAVLVLLILLRLLVYVLYQNLSVKKFFQEFKRNIEKKL